MSVLITFSAYAQDDIKITHAPYLQNLGENEVTVVWTANKPSIGWVELAPDDGTHYYQTERRIELSFEGARYMDIRRWDIGEQTMNGPIYGAVNPATGKKVQIEIRQFRKNKNEVWPIPESEILANPNLKQNQGYVGKD